MCDTRVRTLPESSIRIGAKAKDLGDCIWHGTQEHKNPISGEIILRIVQIVFFVVASH